MLALASLLGAEAAPGAGPPSILLISIDTLRADALGVYGARPSPTPHIDALAREAVVFDRATSPMPMTRPSIFALHTSRYPREHGVMNNRMRLDERSPTVAEQLAARGYRRGAFAAIGLLRARSGIGRGFERLDAPPSGAPRRADEVVTRALAWLDSLEASAPFFLWVHLIDPHLPYDPPADFRGVLDPQLAEQLPAVGWGPLRALARGHGGHLGARVLDHAKALYRAEVAFADREVGRLVAGAEARRPADPPLVVLTADHGECFERGHFLGHHECLLEASTRVPLLVRHAPQLGGPRRSGAPVSLIDVAPTLLEAAGAPIPPEFSGLPLGGPLPDDRYVLIQLPFYRHSAEERWSRQRHGLRSVAGEPVARPPDADRIGIVGVRWKYLSGPPGPELYDLSAPEPEALNRIGRNPARDRSLARALERLRTRHPLRVADPRVVNETLRAALPDLTVDPAADGS